MSGIGLLFFFLGSAFCRAEGLSYVVSDESTLGEISIRVYGTATRWRKIAEANGLGPPFAIRRGQTLRLPAPPTVTKDEGKRRLLEMWRARFGLPSRAETVADQKAEKEAREARRREEEAKHARERDARLQDMLKRIREESTAEGEEIAPPAVPPPAASAAGSSQAPALETYAGLVGSEPSEPARAEPPSAAQSPDELLRQAQGAAKEKKWEEALGFANACRAGDPDLLGCWIIEYRALKELGRKTDADSLVPLLLDRHPMARDLPMFQGAAAN